VLILYLIIFFKYKIYTFIYNNTMKKSLDIGNVDNKINNIERKFEEKWLVETKKYGFSGSTLKHLKTLQRYYDIDLQKRVITIPLHFKHVDEIIEIGVGKETNPVIKRSLLAKISSLAHNIPYEFKIDIDLKIDDYAGYEHANIARSLLDAFEMFHYDLGRKRVNSSIKLIILVVIGVILFAWLFYLCSKHWFGKQGDPTHDTIHELVVTLATVFIWESVYIAFIYDNAYEGISGKLFNRIKTIKLFDSKNVMLDQITNQTIKESWFFDNRIQTISRGTMFIAATTLLCLSGCKAIDIVEAFIKYKDSALALASANITLVSVVVSVLGGIGAISFYRDKGPFKKLLLGLSSINLALNIADVVLCSIAVNQKVDWGLKGLVLALIALVLSAIFLASIIILKKQERNKKKMSQDILSKM